MGVCYLQTLIPLSLSHGLSDCLRPTFKIHGAEFFKDSFIGGYNIQGRTRSKGCNDKRKESIKVNLHRGHIDNNAAVHD